MKKNQGLTIIGLIVVIACIVLLVFLLWPQYGSNHECFREVRCAGNLKQLAAAMNIYLTTLGNGTMYAQPAKMFYGDTWLLTLYWENIVKDPKLFICSMGDDPAKIPSLPPKVYDARLAGDAVSYAGRCFGRTTCRWRNTTDFSKAAMSGNSIMACDDNQDEDNHPFYKNDPQHQGLNAVYFDTHVEFFHNQKSTRAFSQIGAKGTTWANGELEKMDSGGGN